MKEVLKEIGLFLWQLPQNIVALVMYPFLGKKELAKKENGTRAYYAKKMSGGISLGSFIFISDTMRKPETLAHEFGHCVDSRRFGWLYLFIVGIPSLCWAAFKPKEKCYYSFYTEEWANKHAGLLVAKNQYGCHLYFPKRDKEEPKPVVTPPSGNNGTPERQSDPTKPIEIKIGPKLQKKELTLSDKMSMISHMK